MSVFRRAGRRVPLLSSLAIVCSAALLFVTPPASVVRILVSTFPGALLTGSETDPGATRVAKRSLELYVRSALASRLAGRIAAAGEPDHIVLARVVDAVRGYVLNQVQVPHHARTWSTLASGFGYCDQINADVAHVASHFFHDAQIYALYDPHTKQSPHTIGRVWSEDRDDWLYFDAFFDVPIVFTKRADGSPAFLPVDSETMPSRGRAQMEVYRLSGWVMNEYRPSVGGQIGVKLANGIGLGNIERRPGRDAMAAAATPPVVFELPAQRSHQSLVRGAATSSVAERPEFAFQRVVHAYAAARVDHLLEGSPNRSAYLAITSDPAAMRDRRAAEFATAAELFATAQ